MPKAYHCGFCKNPLEKGQVCPFCGQVHFNLGAELLYCEKPGKHVPARVCFTERYLIMRFEDSSGMAGVSFGLVGALLEEAVNARKRISWGFYDLNDIARIEYPSARIGSLFSMCMWKSKNTIHFFNADGTDFLLSADRKNAQAIAAMLAARGIPVEDCSEKSPVKVACLKPFIDRNTFYSHVCESARSFLGLSEAQEPPTS